MIRVYGILLSAGRVLISPPLSLSKRAQNLLELSVPSSYPIHILSTETHVSEVQIQKHMSCTSTKIQGQFETPSDGKTICHMENLPFFDLLFDRKKGVPRSMKT